jgi:hypothetical protein
LTQYSLKQFHFDLERELNLILKIKEPHFYYRNI